MHYFLQSNAWFFRFLFSQEKSKYQFQSPHFYRTLYNQMERWIDWQRQHVRELQYITLDRDKNLSLFVANVTQSKTSLVHVHESSSSNGMNLNVCVGDITQANYFAFAKASVRCSLMYWLQIMYVPWTIHEETVMSIQRLKPRKPTQKCTQT